MYKLKFSETTPVLQSTICIMKNCEQNSAVNQWFCAKHLAEHQASQVQNANSYTKNKGKCYYTGVRNPNLCASRFCACPVSTEPTSRGFCGGASNGNMCNCTSQGAYGPIKGLRCKSYDKFVQDPDFLFHMSSQTVLRVALFSKTPIGHLLRTHFTVLQIVVRKKFLFESHDSNIIKFFGVYRSKAQRKAASRKEQQVYTAARHERRMKEKEKMKAVESEVSPFVGDMFGIGGGDDEQQQQGGGGEGEGHKEFDQEYYETEAQTAARIKKEEEERQAASAEKKSGSKSEKKKNKKDKKNKKHQEEGENDEGEHDDDDDGDDGEGGGGVGEKQEDKEPVQLIDEEQQQQQEAQAMLVRFGDMAEEDILDEQMLFLQTLLNSQTTCPNTANGLVFHNRLLVLRIANLKKKQVLQKEALQDVKEQVKKLVEELKN